ncbi:MAG: hypothetical protein F4113_02590 [Rhodothermaceae bacterium]|nr:hypothetical protein [Rhodothermaceae bacterium]
MRLKIVFQLCHAVLVLALAGTVTELGLLGHFEDPWQWAPIVVLTLCLSLTLTHFFAPRPLIRKLFRISMILCVLTGITGLFLHLKGNFEFELEMYKNLSFFSLLWRSLRGALPALAPGSMIYIGLLGLITALIQPPVSR